MGMFSLGNSLPVAESSIWMLLELFRIVQSLDRYPALWVIESILSHFCDTARSIKFCFTYCFGLKAFRQLDMFGAA